MVPRPQRLELVAAGGAAAAQAYVQRGGLTEQQRFRAAAELRAAHLVMQANIAPLVTALFLKCFSIQLEIAERLSTPELRGSRSTQS